MKKDGSFVNAMLGNSDSMLAACAGTCGTGLYRKLKPRIRRKKMVLERRDLRLEMSQIRDAEFQFLVALPRLPTLTPDSCCFHKLDTLPDLFILFVSIKKTFFF